MDFFSGSKIFGHSDEKKQNIQTPNKTVDNRQMMAMRQRPMPRPSVVIENSGTNTQPQAEVQKPTAFSC